MVCGIWMDVDMDWILIRIINGKGNDVATITERLNGTIRTFCEANGLMETNRNKRRVTDAVSVLMQCFLMWCNEDGMMVEHNRFDVIHDIFRKIYMTHK